MARHIILLAVLLIFGFAVDEILADEPERITGGTDAFPGEFPYQVALKNGDFQFCGGSLISNQHVLTAAHCVYNRKAPFDDIVVLTGTIDIANGGQTHRVEKIIIHKDYIHGFTIKKRHDIAVIKLTAPYLPHIYQSAIPLPTYTMPDNAELTVSGWGVNDQGYSPEILQKATVYGMNNEECQKHTPHPTVIHDTYLCAFLRKGVGACPGDSGGPLTYEGQLVGVVSMGFPCGLGFPDIYTRVSEYLDFIEDALKQ